MHDARGQWLLNLRAQPERFEAFGRWLHSDNEHFVAWAQVNRAIDGQDEQAPTTQEY